MVCRFVCSSFLHGCSKCSIASSPFIFVILFPKFSMFLLPSLLLPFSSSVALGKQTFNVNGITTVCIETVRRRSGECRERKIEGGSETGEQKER